MDANSFISISTILCIVSFLIYKLNQRAVILDNERLEFDQQPLSKEDEVLIGTVPEAEFELVELGKDDKGRPLVVKMLPSQKWWAETHYTTRRKKRELSRRILNGLEPFPELSKLEYATKRDKAKLNKLATV